MTGPQLDAASRAVTPEWITIDGAKPDLPGYVFVFVRYHGETREEAEAHRDGYGQSVDATPNWCEAVEYRRKHARIDPEKLIETFVSALVAGSPEHPYADYDALIWGFHLHDVFGHGGGKVIGALQVVIAQQELALLALEARVADLEQTAGRRQPYGTRLVGDIVQWVSRELDLRASDIRGESRHASLITARQVVTWCARRIIPDSSYPKIARALGGRHHTSAMNADRRADLRRNADVEFRELCDRCIAAFTTNDRISRSFPEDVPPHGNRR